MLDLKILRNELESVAEKLALKNYQLDTVLFEKLENQRKTLQVDTQNLQSERNTKSKSIGQAKARGEDIQPLLDEVSELGEKLKNAEQALDQLQIEIDDLVLGIPNLPHDSVPAGNSEEDN